MGINSYLEEEYNIDKSVIALVEDMELELKNGIFQNIEKDREYNQYKVVKSMKESGLNSTHFSWTTGYGYDDLGREKVEEIYSYLFKGEDSLVRPTIVSGTHAINLVLSALTMSGEKLVYATGSPYDTMRKAIGTEGNMKGTLIDYGVKYYEIPLTNDNKIDIDNFQKYIDEDTKIVAFQRSTGYSDRRAFTIEELKLGIEKVKSISSNIICMVDNCYGEFIEREEPLEVGADIIAGSLIKNPGGGLALTGGYIVGKSNLVELVSNRNTAPGIGKECGLTFGMTRNVLQGLFMAPHISTEALKGSILLAKVFEKLGFETVPNSKDKRSDIVQGIKFESKEKLIYFCKGIQEVSPVDSIFSPEPGYMPGYENEVIMASGAFVQGSSIELSADGPIREPYFGYFQGGLTYEHCKLGIMNSVNKLLREGYINI